MIGSKKGVESFPFFLFLTLLIAAFVVTIGFYQVRIFSDFSSKREITSSYNDLTSAMENLRSTADYGSFTRVTLKIGNGYTMTISENDTILVNGPDFSLNNTPGFDIIGVTDKYKNLKAEYAFERGEYEVIVYYGNYSQENKEPLQIYFI